MVAQNIIQFAKESGFEVRIVDNHNAYTWLSASTEERIREAHHHSRVEMPIAELLRLGLLLEHGGIALRLPDLLLLGGLQWAADLIQGKAEDESALSCRTHAPELVLSHREDAQGALHFSDAFVAARPNAHLISTLFDEVCSIIKNGTWSYTQQNITVIHEDT